LRQRVQTRTCFTEPSTVARTERRFGIERVFVLLFAWETLFPTSGPFPQMSQRRAMACSKNPKERGILRNGGGNARGWFAGGRSPPPRSSAGVTCAIPAT
jgi:hypothetical protein